MTDDLIKLAQVAAYIDGEGCITVGSSKYGAVGVSIANTDPRLVQWLQANFGGRVRTVNQVNPRWSTAYVWQPSVAESVEILKACLPYFVIKRDQAEVALAFRATFSGRRGSQIVAEETYGKRAQLRGQLAVLKRNKEAS